MTSNPGCASFIYLFLSLFFFIPFCLTFPFHHFFLIHSPFILLRYLSMRFLTLFLLVITYIAKKWIRLYILRKSVCSIRMKCLELLYFYTYTHYYSIKYFLLLLYYSFCVLLYNTCLLYILLYTSSIFRNIPTHHQCLYLVYIGLHISIGLYYIILRNAVAFSYFRHRM